MRLIKVQQNNSIVKNYENFYYEMYKTDFLCAQRIRIFMLGQRKMTVIRHKLLHHLVTWNSKKMQTDVKQANICNAVLFFLTNIAYEY